MKRSDYDKIKKEGLELMKKAGIYLTPEEQERMEVTDFGLNDPYREGLMLHVYVIQKDAVPKNCPCFPDKSVQSTGIRRWVRKIREKKRLSVVVMVKYMFMFPESPPRIRRRKFLMGKMTFILSGMRLF